MKRRSVLLGLGASAALTPSLSRAATPGAAMSAAEMGLVPNSTANQTETLRNALAAARRNGLPLFLPAGTYVVSGLELFSGTMLGGVPGQSILATRTGESIFSASAQENITLEGLGFEGSGTGSRTTGGALVQFEGCENLRLANCSVQNFEGNGLYLHSCSGKISGSRFRKIGLSAVHGQNSTGLLISDNRIQDCGNGGIRVWRYENGADHTIVTNNMISAIGSDEGNGQNGNGINIFQADGVIVANNAISDCAFSAIRANSTNNTIIRGNQCINSLEVGIFSEFAFTGSIIADNVVDGAASGISITNFNDGGRLAVCSGNIVRNITPFSPTNPDTVPIAIFAEADTAVTGNVVENVPGLGIGAGWGRFLRDVLVSDNLIRQANVGIAVSVAEGAGRARIVNNMISGAANGAIVGAQWDDIVSRNLERDSALYPNVTLLGNVSD